MRNVISIALAFIGLIVGAGFATGQEMVQYFISFGTVGLWGTLIAGLMIAITGIVILQLGSYYLADEHQSVFRSATYTWVAWLLDIAVMITLFALGFVMLAGAGSTISQQFGGPSWIGSTIMVVLIIVTGLLDVEKVSKIIGGLTPFVILVVLVAFIYTMFHMPSDWSHLDQLAQQTEPPIRPWWLSAINYAGLDLILAVSMVLVIGGSYINPKDTGRGGLLGGAIFTILMLLSSITLFLNMDEIQGSSVPMLQIFQNMNGWASYLVVWVVYGMIYNTCIGMFYALGRRISVKDQSKFRVRYIVLCLVGYAISFVGFKVLMEYVYPVLGYLGAIMVVVLVASYLKDRPKISAETERRVRLRSLFLRSARSGRRLSRKERREVRAMLHASNIDEKQLRDTVREEVREELEEERDSTETDKE
ncbi:hypothetical protein L1O03_07440 [Corynebacterium uropygiale]|uniref:Membrane protein YkvI n=1 Tax=Corynebacterium uropygiale TaxID=1775911 RepID=A0A9X1TZK7_9CORY|nr:hypothetical protein [Corynebacterium uropygiale]MCF4007011.1 hypothetical protein [Corynebacterium uropygiale]